MAINYTQSFGNTTPPAWLTPYLQGGAQRAQGLLGQNTLANQSQNTLDAQNLIAQRARAGSPANAAASGYVTDAISGKYLPGQPGANPWLDATFNQASLATQNQLASQFGGSGRNIAASYAPRADQLNNLATSIYGGAYNQERALQQQAAGMAGQVSQAGYMDANALAGVGAAQDLRAQQVADQPGQSLDDYLRRIGGVANSAGQETTQSDPYYTNNTANVLGILSGVNQLTGGYLSDTAKNYLTGLLGNGASGSGAAGGLGAAGGAGFDAWLGTGATDAITGAVAPTLAPIAGETAGGAGLIGGSGAAAGTAAGTGAYGGGLASGGATGLGALGALGAVGALYAGLNALDTPPSEGSLWGYTRGPGGISDPQGTIQRDGSGNLVQVPFGAPGSPFPSYQAFLDATRSSGRIARRS